MVEILVFVSMKDQELSLRIRRSYIPLFLFTNAKFRCIKSISRFCNNIKFLTLSILLHRFFMDKYLIQLKMLQLLILLNQLFKKMSLLKSSSSNHKIMHKHSHSLYKIMRKHSLK